MQKVLKCLFVGDVSNLSGLALQLNLWYVFYKGVHFFGGVLILVSLAAHLDADPEGNVANTLPPNSLVQVSIDTDIGGAHGLLGEGLDLTDRTRCLSLEGAASSIKCSGGKDKHNARGAQTAHNYLTANTPSMAAEPRRMLACMLP